ncbi:MAG: hypothetical protein KVP17_004146 [Porospora cf. gigantea B]|uniref:uncharacterized protein n=1 Tax=Porospora cf. gigantea B TaxID=2853592 RepID=UPI00357197C5|nr:MAG: hypothetical protein KVP17_004146 [Porospora cf. gigantea B]
MEPIQVREYNAVAPRVERVGVHSHITGLGLNGLEPEYCSQGMVGQLKARKAAGVILKLIEKGTIAGRSILIAGQPGTGKTAIALGIARQMNEEAAFVHISGPEVFSMEVSKTEVLTQSLRRAITIKIQEVVEVIEGEVVELEVDRPAAGGQGKKTGKMTLRTTDMETMYDLGTKIIAELQKQEVCAGDVVSVNRSTNQVAKLGRSFQRSRDFDAVDSLTKFVMCPEGEVQKTKEVVHTVSLHDIDIINSRTQGFLAIFAGDTGEVKPEVRSQIDQKIAEWVEEGKCTVLPGVLFIDEVHMLDVECFSFLNRALETEQAPLVVMATNRGVATIRGTEFKSPHGIPLDLLDRTLIVATEAYSEEDVLQILNQRLTSEGVQMTDDAKSLLTKIAADSSLRYALNLVSLSQAASSRRQATEVEPRDVERCFALFADLPRSVAMLRQFESEFLYGEVRQ